MKFPGVITMDKSYVHAKGQGQRSNIKFTEVKVVMVHIASRSIEEAPNCF